MQVRYDDSFLQLPKINDSAESKTAFGQAAGIKYSVHKNPAGCDLIPAGY